jgi:hypothetical protein
MPIHSEVANPRGKILVRAWLVQSGDPPQRAMPALQRQKPQRTPGEHSGDLGACRGPLGLPPRAAHDPPLNRGLVVGAFSRARAIALSQRLKSGRELHDFFRDRRLSEAPGIRREVFGHVAHVVVGGGHGLQA